VQDASTKRSYYDVRALREAKNNFLVLVVKSYLIFFWSLQII
jgi:hypothetical protein